MPGGNGHVRRLVEAGRRLDNRVPVARLQRRLMLAAWPCYAFCCVTGLGFAAAAAVSGDLRGSVAATVWAVLAGVFALACRMRWLRERRR